MRKLRYLLGTCIVGIVALTTSAFAYFNFSSNSTTNTSANAKSSDYVNNIKFDNNSTEDSERLYTLYFFASPYYACGLESETISANTDALNGLTDPLTIANSSDNPYIDSTSYCITSKTALSDSEDKRYSNFQDSDGNYKFEKNSSSINYASSGNMGGVKIYSSGSSNIDELLLRIDENNVGYADTTEVLGDLDKLDLVSSFNNGYNAQDSPGCEVMTEPDRIYIETSTSQPRQFQRHPEVNLK